MKVQEESEKFPDRLANSHMTPHKSCHHLIGVSKKYVHTFLHIVKLTLTAFGFCLNSFSMNVIHPVYLTSDFGFSQGYCPEVSNMNMIKVT